MAIPPAEVDLTIHNVRYDVYERLQAIAKERGQTVEDVLRDQVEKFSGTGSTDQRSMEEVMQSIRARREKIAARGPVLNPGETLKDLAREGLDDA